MASVARFELIIVNHRIYLGVHWQCRGQGFEPPRLHQTFQRHNQDVPGMGVEKIIAQLLGLIIPCSHPDFRETICKHLLGRLPKNNYKTSPAPPNGKHPSIFAWSRPVWMCSRQFCL